MSTERDALLAKFNAGQFEAPTSDQNLRKVANVFRETVRDQGQVMSLALDNNKNLYEANKQLRKDNAELAGEVRVARVGVAARDREIEELKAQLEKLNQLHPEVVELDATREECVKWKTVALEYRKVLESYLYEELNQTQLREKLDEMKAQKAEIVATGQVYDATKEEDPR